MIGKILCWLGIHKWEFWSDMITDPPMTEFETSMYECSRCGKMKEIYP